ncbi:MAG: RNA repair transcriptional activator RtcR [Gammaproteobacteria bacterium]|nr:RNA repair transcriptional activator RtcR [Gammaproteobacteria bacterium]MDH5803114.1 RNA repair transcriptional activator RtcR [Gammaproteobacteria bacterium]
MKTIAISLLGTVLDQRGRGKKRWEKWRPTLSLCQQEDLLIDRMELVFQARYQSLADLVTQDIKQVSPETEVHHHLIELENPWDFEEVYGALHDFAREYPFKRDKEDYLIHITTGTHVAQICLYLLTEAHYLPGRLVQTSPPDRGLSATGRYQIIDLDLSKYDQIASRFFREHKEGTVYLKGGIETKNKEFNRVIAQLEKISINSRDPILLTGPTGAGKSQLAQRVYQLKQQRDQVNGRLVEVNCATLRGENAMSALFGHKKGAFTGAASHRAGLLLEANEGVLFLDEIGELGADEQAMLLRAIEDKNFIPFGSDTPVSSNFQLIAGTNRDLFADSRSGRFREDLLARINLWTYRLPALKERMEDLEVNLDYELERFAQKAGALVSFNKAARKRYLQFAHSDAARWRANFRDLNASVTRMATLADGGRITEDVVQEEIVRLRHDWSAGATPDDPKTVTAGFLDPELHAQLDLFEHIQLAGVVQAVRKSRSMAEAGRQLFDQSRKQKRSSNDSHRLKQFLAKYKLEFEQLHDDA